MNDKEQKAIEAEIRAIADHIFDASRHLDVDRCFAPIGELPVGAIQLGGFLPTREDAKSLYREQWGREKSLDFADRDTRIAVLAPNVAIATEHYHFTVHHKDGSVSEGAGGLTQVFMKESDGWKVVHFHESSVPLPAA